MPFASSRAGWFIVSVLGMFVVLSAADLALTWKLVESKGMEVIESNPVAARVLERFGWLGLAAFKTTLVLAISGLALRILRRQRRAGELTIVFGCGAQAAVVITSICLWCVPTPSDLPEEESSTSDAISTFAALPKDAMYLLMQKSVQEELKLAPEQLNDLKELDRLRREFRQGMRQWTVYEWRENIELVMNEEASFANGLTPAQAKRLQQLSWQYRGPLSFLEPEVRSALKLTLEQHDLVHSTAMFKLPDRRQTTSGRASADRTAFNRKLWACLDAGQQAAWKEIIGPPFHFPEHAAPVDAVVSD